MSLRINSYATFPHPVRGARVFGSKDVSVVEQNRRPVPGAGLWKTTDRGLTWVNKKTLVAGTKVTADVATYAVTSITLDPQDSNAVYFGTNEHGLIYSLDGENLGVNQKHCRPDA